MKTVTEISKYFPRGMMILDDEGIIVSSDEGIEKMLGIKGGDFTGRPFRDLKLLLNRGEAVGVVDQIKRRKNLTAFAEIMNTDGKRIPVLFQARVPGTPLPEGGTILLLISLLNEGFLTGEVPGEEHLFNQDGFRNIIGQDKKMQGIFRMIRQAADSVANIFIFGESGTGKELVAGAIHNLSGRSENPFVTVNCSALSEGLLESELFGHVKGAFTGAIKEKIGKFEAAHTGTVFLDEIGDISQAIQLKLLRVIQEKTIVRVGDNREIKVDMRIITATNKNIRDMVNSGEFREDLFYRLKVFTIQTLPLREREGDIPLLCRHFIKNFNRQTGKSIKDLTNDAYRLFLDYCWPGNVRELENAIEHAFVICTNEYIDVFDLPVELRSHSLRKEYCRRFSGMDQVIRARDEENENSSGEPDRSDRTKDELIKILEKNNWNKTKTAEEIGMSRVGLWKKLKKLDIKR